MIFERFPSVAVKSEDCLRLNVFSPEWDPTKSDQVCLSFSSDNTDILTFLKSDGFAVMVFIHGGGFAVHSSAHYGDHGICE